MACGDRTETTTASREDSKRQIILTSNDNHSFTVPLHNFLQSSVITDLIRACPTESDGKLTVIPLANVSGFILKKVIDWADHHKDDPVSQLTEQDDGIANGAPITSNRGISNSSNWIRQLSSAFCWFSANYLDLKPLLETGAKVVAKMMKGKTPEELRRTFNIKCDFGEGEEEQIKKENAWCVE